jgi:hypothetical protein
MRTKPVLKYSLIWFFIILAIGIILYFIQFYSGISVNGNNADWWIRHHNYVISSSTTETKDVYIITKGKWVTHYKRYRVKTGDALEVTVNKDSEFILSLYTHAENHGFKWHLSNNTNPHILQCVEDNYMEPSVLKIEYNSSLAIGGSTRRENFLLKTLNEGYSSMNIKYLFDGDMNKMKETGNYNIVISQQFDFYINVHIK